MKLSYSLLGLASGQYFQSRGGSVVGLGCGVLDNCQSNQVCVVDVGFELGKCVTIPSAIQRRDEEQAPGPQTLADTIYEARQARRKQLLKEKMAKKLWEDQYEDVSTRSGGGGVDVDESMRDFNQLDRDLEASFNQFQNSMYQMERDMEREEASMDPSQGSFQSFEKSSSKINDEPELVSMKTNDNGKINTIEEEIGADGEPRILSDNSNTDDEAFEPMPQPAKRVAALPDGGFDQADLYAMNEEKKAMVLTFGAGGLLCAVLIVSGITLYTTSKKRRTPPLDFPAGDYEQLCRQHFAAKESQEISPTEWNDSKDSFNVPNDELTIEQARALLHASTEEESLLEAWKNANTSPSDESTNGGGEHPGKDRDPGFLPYEVNRFKFKQNEIYYNASNVTLSDESWLLAQSPLPNQLADFWTMIWESQRTALILLSPLQEDGMPQSARFWPNEGAELHGGIEVNLVTEHVWCREFLVRSLYLRHIETGETRTVTLLHYLGWPLNSTPPSAKRLLEFRRKARRAGSPAVICPDGALRAGTYCLIDATICGYSNGHEPKPAELLSSLRGQRMKAIKNLDQLNFVTEALSEAAESSLAR